MQMLLLKVEVCSLEFARLENLLETQVDVSY